ncbi:MAG: transposase [Candidatus Paceibacterota bacterium]
MPNVKREFINGEIFHLFNRGVEKRIIFTNDNDYYRFVFCLYECNDTNSVRMSDRIFDRQQRNLTRSHLASLQGATLHNSQKQNRKPLVEVIGFTLMPNHYHLIVRQLIEGGISLFMKKLGDSYTGYFNEKHERKGMGALFQGRFKAVHVISDEQFMHLVEYIFSNPIEIIESDWKRGGVRDATAAIDFLNNYKWSSYSDSIGTKNFPSVTVRDFLWKVFGGSDDVEKGMEAVKIFTQDWIKNKRILPPSLSFE